MKPKYGYDYPESRKNIFFPRGWDTEEKKAILKKRRVFFEVELFDWVVRHDIQGDGLLVKTIHQRGRGFDRPSKNDNICINIKIYQHHKVFLEKEGLRAELQPDCKELYASVQRIVESMKAKEKATCIVQPAFFLNFDDRIRSAEGGFPDIDEDNFLLIDLELLELNVVTDLYRDGTTMVKTLEQGNTGNTASPFNDCQVLVRLKLEIDGKTTHDSLSEDSEPLLYDLEEFQVPAVFRKVIKQTKLEELVQMTSTKKTKLQDLLPDRHGVFGTEEYFNFQKDIRITVRLLDIIQKPHMFKVYAQEKVDRHQFLAGIAE